MRIPIWVVLSAAGVIFSAAVFTRTIPYWIVLPFAVGWLAAEHASSPLPSDRSKQSVVVTTVWATAVASTWPPAVIPAVLALAGVGVYTILYRDLAESAADVRDREPR